MNIIETMRDILQAFPRIAALCNTVHVEFADDTPDSYGLSSVGDALVSSDILGNQLRQHSFMLYSTFSGINDYERMANSSTLLELAAWLEQQRGRTVTTTVGNRVFGGIIEEIAATNGMLNDLPDDTGKGGIQYVLQITVQYTVER